MHKAGDVILIYMQFADSYETKKRPALILFSELGNIVVAGITSNIKMQGIPLLKKEGAVKDSVIKLNYIFTTSEKLVVKKLFHISKDKKRVVYKEFMKRLSILYG